MWNTLLRFTSTTASHSLSVVSWSGLAGATLAAVYAARGVFGVRRPAVAAFVVIANIAAVLCTAWLALEAARTTENGLVWLLSAGSERDAGHRPLLQVVDIYPDREMSGIESLAGPDQLWLEAERRRRVAVAGWGLSREQLRGVGAAAIFMLFQPEAGLEDDEIDG